MLDYNKIFFDTAKLLLKDLPSLLRLFGPYLLILAGIALLKYAWRLHERQKLAALGIDGIDTLTGREFEKYLDVLFTQKGYRVELTPSQGDWGADHILEKDGVRTAVQAKRYKGNVGVKAVQEAAAAKGKYRCTNAMVVTNSFYTKAARELAAANGVELWDRDKLKRELTTLHGPAAGRCLMLPARPGVPLAAIRSEARHCPNGRQGAGFQKARQRAGARQPATRAGRGGMLPWRPISA
jgi:restriction system protein